MDFSSRGIRLAVASMMAVFVSSQSVAQYTAGRSPEVTRVYDAIGNWNGNFGRLADIVSYAKAVESSDADYDSVLFIRGVAATILVSAYRSENFSLRIGRNESADVISYEAYFGSLFRYGSAPAQRQQWQRVPVMVAVSSPVGCDIDTMMDDSATFIGHWMNGARDPIRPSVTFGVSLTMSDALSDQNLDGAKRECRNHQANLGTLDNPRFVVVGRLICAEAACSSLPKFLVSRIYYTYSGANTLPGYGDYMSNALSILSDLRQAGVR